jgi:hypothetical protein
MVDRSRSGPDALNDDPLNDVSFLLPFSFDCHQRVENIWATTRWIRSHFNGPVLIGGHDLERVAGVVRGLGVDLVPVDRDVDGQWRAAPVRNALARAAPTRLLAVWDADVFCAPDQVRRAAEDLRQDRADFVYPYDGTFVHVDPAAAYGVSSGIGHPHEAHVVTTHPGESVGGAVLFAADCYAEGGRENADLIGWGPDDRERYDRFTGSGYRCTRVAGPLYHLDHDRPHERYRGQPSYLANMQPLLGRPPRELPHESCPVCRTETGPEAGIRRTPI